MRAILEIAGRLYRAAQDSSAQEFEDVALAALESLVHFGSALWFRGGFAHGRFQFHHLHGYRLPPAALQQLISVCRRFPHAIAMGVASPGVAHVLDAAVVFGKPDHRPALECARRWGLERWLAIAEIERGASAGEWLSLHRAEADSPFNDRDRTLLRVLVPHLFGACAVNRALQIAGAAKGASLGPAHHRALTLLDGTVLHCGSEVSDSIAFGWPDWDGIRLPWPLLQKLIREGSVSLEARGDSICAQRLADTLLLSVKSVPLSARLTRREHEVVQYFGAGQGYKEIARRCGLSPATVRNIVQRSYRKLGINNKAQLARLISRAEGES
jgi:DNA-binding CsgD family transcriptional regulator